MCTDVKQTGLTPEEAGQILGCSAYTVKDLARRNKIPFYKIESRYRFCRESLLEWIATQQKENYKGGIKNGKH